MALLNEATRVKLWEQFMRDNEEAFGAMLKLDIRAAFDAIDQWAEDNQASFNAALPQPFRSVATPKQKARAFMLVIAEKFKVL